MGIEQVQGWLPLVLVVAGAFATWGSYRSRFRSVETSQREQGKRIGKLEGWRERLEGREEGRAGRRSLSRAVPVAPDPPDDESGPEGA